MRMRYISPTGKINVFAHANKNGFAFLMAIMVMVSLAVLGFGIIAVTDTETQISDNYRSHTRGLYMAESGVERIISYFNSPSSFTDMSGTYNGYSGASTRFFEKRRVRGGLPSYFNTAGLSQFEDTDDNGIIDSPAHDHNNPVLLYSRDAGSAQQSFLESITPEASVVDYIEELMVFAPPPGTGAVATIRVTGQVRNTLRTVEQVVMPGPVLAFKWALTSHDHGGWQGNSLSVHWGPVAILGSPAELKNPIEKNPKRTVDAAIDSSSYPGSNGEDRWLRVFSRSAYSGVGYDEPTYDNPPDDWGEQKAHPYESPHHNLFCNEPVLLYDNWEYREAKRIAQRYGRYYTTDAGGNLYLDGKGPALDFKSLTNGRNCGIVFVDTLDKTPPNAGNLSTISFSGSYSTRGIFYIGANFSTNGLGTGSSADVLAPPILMGQGSISAGSNTLLLSSGTTAGMRTGDILLIGRESGHNSNIEEFRITNVDNNLTLTVASTADRNGYALGTTPAWYNHNNESFNIITTVDESTRVSVSGLNYNFWGVLYCAGQVDMQGGPNFFGSIVAERGFTSGGNPEVWYDWNLSKLDLLGFGISNVTRGAWREIY